MYALIYWLCRRLAQHSSAPYDGYLWRLSWQLCVSSKHPIVQMKLFTDYQQLSFNRYLQVSIAIVNIKSVTLITLCTQRDHTIMVFSFIMRLLTSNSFIILCRTFPIQIHIVSYRSKRTHSPLSITISMKAFWAHGYLRI